MICLYLRVHKPNGVHFRMHKSTSTRLESVRNNLNKCSCILMIYLYLQGSWVQSDTVYSLRALKLSTLENFRALKTLCFGESGNGNYIKM